MRKTPIVVLDRDGVVIIDKHYLHKPDGVEFAPGAIEAIALIQQLQLPMVLATGQSGIGRGKYQEEDMHRVHARMFELLRNEGLSGEIFMTIAWCPHSPDVACDCRKPGIRMLDDIEYRLKDKLQIEWRSSWAIGDKPADSEMILTKGGKAILLRSEHWNEATQKDEKGGDISDILSNPRNVVVGSFLEAVQTIQKNQKPT